MVTYTYTARLVAAKTTLLKTISQTLDDDDRNIVNFLNAPNLKTANALLRRICNGFEVKTERSYEATLENLTTWLVDQHKEGRFPVLIVDEAQNIVRDGLKTLHCLMTYVTNDDLPSNDCPVRSGTTGYLNLSGFPRSKAVLYPSALSALSREETEDLIRYRWQVASVKKDNPLPFGKGALDAVFDYAKGLPREVCKVCDLALLAAMTEKKRSIGGGRIKSVAQGLALEGGKHVNR